MSRMRKRGFVVLAACLPIWTIAAWLNWHREYPTNVNGWILFSEPSDFQEGANWAALIGATVVVALLLTDFVKYVRGTSSSHE